MADEKVSAMALLSAGDTNRATDYLPIIDPSEASAADRNKRQLMQSVTAWPIQAKTANYTVVAADSGTIISVTNNSVTISFTAAATLGADFQCWVQNNSISKAHTTTIDPNGAETIDGLSTLILRPGEGWLISSNGSNLLTQSTGRLRLRAENSTTNTNRPVATGVSAVADGVSAIASGDYSWAGSGGTASGAGSRAMSNLSGLYGEALASADNSDAFGDGALANAIGKQALASGVFAGTFVGEAQGYQMVLRRQTTNGTSTILTSDNAAAGVANQMILPNDSAQSFFILIIERNTGSNECASFEAKGAIQRGAGAATTALVGVPAVVSLGADAGAATWAAAVTADTTNGCLALTVTGESGKTINWVAYARAAEVVG